MEQGREERVRARAYEIWEREGRTEGSHEAHWQQAERELEGERAGAPDTSGQSEGSRGSAASTEGDEAVVKVLLDKGAEVNAQGGSGVDLDIWSARSIA